MADPTARTRIEASIIEKSWRIDVSKPHGEWTKDAEFDEFIAAWDELIDYYTEHPDDTVMGIELIREYLHISRLLRWVPTLSADISIRERAEEAIVSLERRLEEIIREVVMYLDSTTKPDV